MYFPTGEYVRPRAPYSDSFSPIAPAVGKVFGPFRLLGRIGQGGMADIFLALRTDQSDAVPCVVKRIQPDRMEDVDSRRLFQEECRICLTLKHPNIVRHTDFGVIDEIPYLTMELVDGVDLESLRLSASLSQTRNPRDGLRCCTRIGVCARLDK